MHLPPAVMQASAGRSLVTAVGSLISTVLDWRPSGPLFMVFAFAAVASGSGWSDASVALLVSLASAAFAVDVGNIGAVARGRTAADRSSAPWRREPLRASWSPPAYPAPPSAGIGHPYWAMVAAAAPLTVRGRDYQTLRAAHRIARSALGLATSARLLHLGLDPVGLVLVVVALQILNELCGRNYGLASMFVTLFWPSSFDSSERPPCGGELLHDRLVETHPRRTRGSRTPRRRTPTHTPFDVTRS